MLDINGSLKNKNKTVLLTRNDPVSILQSMEVVHELLYGNSKGLKQTCVLKEPVRNLGQDMRKTSYLTSVEVYMCIYCLSLRYKPQPHDAANCGHFQSIRAPFNYITMDVFSGNERHMSFNISSVISAYLTEDAAGLAVRLLHQSEDGEVPVVELTHQRFQPWHHQRLQGQDWLVLSGRGKGRDEKDTDCTSAWFPAFKEKHFQKFHIYPPNDNK